MEKQFLKVIGGLLIGLTLFSCSKEEIETNSNDSINSENSYLNEQVYLSLLEKGYTVDDIEVSDDYYVVEGDIVFEKSNNYSSETDLKATNSSNLRIWDEDTRVSDVKFYIFPGILNDEDFYPAFLEAMNRWNDVLNDIELSITTNRDEATTDVKFAREAETEDEATFLGYYFGFEGSVNTIGGLAQVGYKGIPGNDIWLNGYIDHSANCWQSNDETRQSDLTETIQHEIGHVLGFYHTGSDDGIHVEGSVDQDDDIIIRDGWEVDYISGGSIMQNGGPCYNVALSFSEGDIKGIENIYGMPEHGVQYKNYTLDLLVSDKMINYPASNYQTVYSGSGSLDKDSGGYFTPKYFDGSFNVSWDISILGGTNYVRVKVLDRTKTEVLYDKWVYKYNTIDDEEYSSEFGITIPKEYYLDSSRDTVGYIQVFYGGTIYKDEAHFYISSIDE